MLALHIGRENASALGGAAASEDRQVQSVTRVALLLSSADEHLVGEEILPGISDRKLSGYHGAYLLRRSLAEEVEFATITKFDSIEAVQAFAGEDYEDRVRPAPAREVLKRFDDRSAHYEVLLSPEETRAR